MADLRPNFRPIVTDNILPMAKHNKKYYGVNEE
jgi:hypothetical protein